MAKTGDDLMTSGLCAAMRFDHERLTISTRHFLECVLFGRSDIVEQAFRRVCNDILLHIEAEQKFILPAFEKEYPEAAQAIHDDHALIRALLVTIYDQISRRAIAPDVVRKLIEAVRQNGDRECQELYPWAETGVSPIDSKAAIELVRLSRGDEIGPAFPPPAPGQR